MPPNSKLSGRRSKVTTASIKPAANSKIQLSVFGDLKLKNTPINPPIKVPKIPKKETNVKNIAKQNNHLLQDNMLVWSGI